MVAQALLPVRIRANQPRSRRKRNHPPLKPKGGAPGGFERPASSVSGICPQGKVRAPQAPVLRLWVLLSSATPRLRLGKRPPLTTKGGAPGGFERPACSVSGIRPQGKVRVPQAPALRLGVLPSSATPRSRLGKRPPLTTKGGACGRIECGLREACPTIWPVKKIGAGLKPAPTVLRGWLLIHGPAVCLVRAISTFRPGRRGPRLPPSTHPHGSRR